MLRFSASIGGVAGLACIVGLWIGLSGQPAVDLANQAWVNRRPESPRDAVNWFVALDRRGARHGVVQRASVYRFAGERFRWSRQGPRLTLRFPQSDRKVEVKARAYRCQKGVFDRCLDLEREGRKVTLYSMKGWRIPATGRADLPRVHQSPLDGDCEVCMDALPDVLDALFE